MVSGLGDGAGTPPPPPPPPPPPRVGRAPPWLSSVPASGASRLERYDLQPATSATISSVASQAVLRRMRVTGELLRRGHWPVTCMLEANIGRARMNAN